MQTSLSTTQLLRISISEGPQLLVAKEPLRGDPIVEDTQKEQQLKVLPLYLKPTAC